MLENGMELTSESVFDFMMVMLLCLPRLGGALFLVPFFSESVIGGVRNRSAIILVMGLFLYPLVSAQLVPQTSMGGLMGLLVKEVVLGLLMGVVILTIFWGFQMIGALIDNQRGATAASSMDPLVGEQSSPLGTLMLQSCIFLFFIGGGFYLYLSMIYQSSNVWPVTSFYPAFSMELVNFLVQNLLYSLQLCVLLASPIMIILFLTEFSMGLIGRFAPQLDVFFLAMPVKCVVAVLFLLLCWRLFIEHLDKEIIVIIESIAELFTLV